MTIFEVPNIEHCTVTEVANGRYYTIIADEGWFLHLNDGSEEPDSEYIWKGAMILTANYDYSQLEIRAEADLPADAIICADNSKETI